MHIFSTNLSGSSARGGQPSSWLCQTKPSGSCVLRVHAYINAGKDLPHYAAAAAQNKASRIKRNTVQYVVPRVASVSGRCPREGASRACCFPKEGAFSAWCAAVMLPCSNVFDGRPTTKLLSKGTLVLCKRCLEPKLLLHLLALLASATMQRRVS